MTSEPDASCSRTLTIRMPSDEARRAELVARADGLSVNQLTRRALTAYIEQRRTDEAFLSKARAQLELDAALLEGRQLEGRQ